MGVFENFPYTNVHNLNLDWILTQLKELSNKVETITTDILTDANKYTDEQISQLRQELNTTVVQLQFQYNQFVDLVNANLALFDAELKRIDKQVDDKIIAVNARTDLAIQHNNEYIKDYIASQLIDVKVINYFTGAQTTVQDMFDYLAQFHLENAIKYSEITASGKTYAQIAALNASYSELAANGKTIIGG